MGVWAEDLSGVLRLIVREGDTIDVDDGPGEDFRKVLGLSVTLGGTYVENDSFNNLGQLAFSADFGSGDSRGVFVSNLVAVPEPSAGILLTLAIMASLSQRRVRR
jgi:hypothetical protein